MSPRRCVVLFTVTGVLAGGVVPFAAVAASTPSKAIANDVSSMPDQVSALMAAHRLGHRVQIDDQTTPTVATYANPDGSLTSEMSDAPVRVHRADGWHDVDTTLQVVGDRVEPSVAVETYSFSDGGTAPLVTWRGDGSKALSLSWPGSLPAPTLSGDTATYANALPGVDLLLAARRAGWEVSLRINAPISDGLSVSLPITLTGLHSVSHKDGSFAFADTHGKSVIDAPVGEMWDATKDNVTGESKHRSLDAARIRNSSLVITAPSAFLNDPSTVYPVTIDPPMDIDDTSDLYVDKATPTTAYYHPAKLYLGYSGTDTDRDFLFFNDWTKVRGKHILSAQLQLYNSYSSTCTNNSSNEEVDLYSLKSAWTYQTTWNTQPALNVKQGSAMFAHGQNSTCPAAYQDITATGVVAGWANYTDSTGMLALVATTETSVSSWKNFYSAESTSGGIPSLVVSYNSYPTTPTSLSPANNAYWGGAQPSLSAVVTDPDGGYVQGKFFVQDVTAGDTWVSSSSGTYGNTVYNGNRSAWTTPTLTDGHTYRYQVESSDGVPDVSAPTAWTTFTEDMTAPTAPTVSSTDYPSGQWAAGAGSGNFTFGATDSGSGVDHYLYGLDTPTPESATASGASGPPSPIAVSGGWHTLYVRAVDKAGNLSAITADSFGAGPGILSPSEGAVTARSVTLTATAGAGASQATFYYRRTAQDSWTQAPAAYISPASGSPAFTSWPYSFTALTGNGDHSPGLIWDVASTLGVTSSPLQVGVCFGNATTCPVSPGTTLPAGSSSATPIDMTLDMNSFNVAATQDIGPGSVNLLTGNLQVSASDASVPGNGTSLSVGRTFNNFTSGTTNGIFGPGWTASLPVASAGSDWTGLSDTGTVLTLTQSDQSTVSFDSSPTGVYTPTGDDSDSGMTVVADTTTTNCRPNIDYYRCYKLSDLDGNVTEFRTSTGGTSQTLPPATGSQASPVPYVVYSVSQPGNNTTTSYSFSGGHFTQILAPVPSGATCTNYQLTASWTAGCRALEFFYNGAGDLISVMYATNDGTNLLQVDIACYDYDANGRLSHEWDPRNVTTPGTGTHPIACNPAAEVRPTTYTYDANGRLSTITPAGLAGSTFNYDGSGRLSTVAQSDGTTTYTTAVFYNVALAADGSNPQYRPDMTAGTTSTWAQMDAPDPSASAGRTAVCSPGASLPADHSGNLDDCTIAYLDVDGREVNSASYSGTGASGWHITTTEYDAGGHVVRTLSASDREEALSPTTGAGAVLGLPSSTPAAALDLSTINVYANSVLDGQPDLIDTFGPYHQVELANGSVVFARAHTHTTYDDGTEPGHPKDGLNQPIAQHLVRTQAVGASMSADAVSSGDADVRTTTTQYWLGTDYTGWTYHSPMQTIVDLSGLAITTATRYDTNTGNVIESRMPSNTAGGGAGTTDTIYYTADASASDPNCRSKVLWAGLVCKTTPAGQPGVAGLPGLVTTWTSSYDYLQRPTVVQESVTDAGNNTETRTTTTTYGFNGNANPYAGTTYSVAVSGGGSSALAVPTITTTYDTTTGLATGTSASVTNENPATGTSTTYDTFGRVHTFTDDTSATGGQVNTTTTTYDSAGRVSSTSDAHTTETWTYNGGTEHRGQATSLAVVVAGSTTYSGTFSATYDSNGAIATETDPNQVTVTPARDESGQLVALTDTQNGSAWMNDVALPSISGQWLQEAGPSATHYYTYDAAGRLTQAIDSQTETCAIRGYTYDVDSNRLSSTAYPANIDGSCQTATPYTGGVTTSHTYDSADRLQPSGNDAQTAYDAFGRITTVPSADVTGGNNLTATYYGNDLVRSQTQNGVTECWTLDADQQLKHAVTYSSGTCTGTVTADRTNHYDDASSDSPDWIAENASASSWTANITDLFGSLAVTVDQTGTPTYDYADLHGDIAGTASAGGAFTVSPDYGEFGTNPGTASRYGWLGAKQRSNDDLGGVVLMGVRLYDPLLGRFLSTDPVPGGSANAYDYTKQDPVNAFDLDGRQVARDDNGAGGCITICSEHSYKLFLKHLRKHPHHWWSSVWHHVEVTVHNDVFSPFARADYWRVAEGVEFALDAAVVAGIGYTGAAALWATCPFTGGFGCWAGGFVGFATSLGVGALGYASFTSFRDGFAKRRHHRHAS